MYKQSKPRKILNYSHDRIYERILKSPEILFEFPDIPHRSLYYVGMYVAKSQGFYTKILT